MQGTPTVGHCGGDGNAQKTACFGCLDPDILSLSFRFSFWFVFLINGSCWDIFMIWQYRCRDTNIFKIYTCI